MVGFYGSLGWGLDADRCIGDNFRIVRLTPAGSGCSIQFGAGVTSAAPGSAQDMYLTVSDIEAACAELVAGGYHWPVPWPATAARLLVARYPAVVRGGTVTGDPCTTMSMSCHPTTPELSPATGVLLLMPIATDPGSANGRPGIPI
jgi:hypothetical protein